MQLYTTNLVPIVAKIAATGLCLASAAFGAVYAARIGIQHSIVLAGITVLFVVCLELIKPLALVAAFQAFREWSPVRGLALAALANIAIAYSLTAELALTASSRSDLVAHRQADTDTAKRAQERHTRASQELATLKPSRTIGELEALIAKQSAKGCGTAKVSTGSWVCPVNTSLLQELSRAKRKTELEAILYPPSNGDGPSVVLVADPGSAALTTYLAAMGVVVPVEAVAQWVALVPVVALELGSALAGLLVQAVGRPGASLSQPTPQAEATEKDRVANAIVSHLQSSGGAVRGSQRKLAAKLGADRNTLSRAIHSLAASGLVAMAATKTGTVLKLAA
jgi:CRP-like cAMP-binding protein